MNKQNSLIEQQLNHRTIREFTEDQISDQVISQLEEVAIHTATSTGMQYASVIRVKDPEKKAQIAEVCNQDYVARAPELWIFIVDLYRNTQIAKEHDADTVSSKQLERFLQGYSDAVLMAQNVNNAVESLEMGAVFLGSIQNNMGAMIDILQLPELTAPVLGLAFGHPNQEPQLKPRIPKEMRIFEDTYHYPDNAKEIMDAYDQEMTTYYDLRDSNRRVDSFYEQVVKKSNLRQSRREELIEDLRKQGFNVQPIE